MASPPSKPAPELPAEIIYKIFDDVGEDKVTLLCLALVSRIWRDCSRSHLFRDLTFNDVRSLTQFARLYRSQYCSFPKSFRSVVLRLRIRANTFESNADQLLISTILVSMSVKDTLTIFVGKRAIPPWISSPTKNWKTITSVKIVGGKHPLSQFREYLASFPKLESLHLEGVTFRRFKAYTEQYPVPATVTKLALNIRPRLTAPFREGIINGGGLSKVVDLEIWTAAKFVRSDKDLGWGALTKLFGNGDLQHLERLTIHQLLQDYTGAGKCLSSSSHLFNYWVHKFEGLYKNEIRSNKSTISLRHVDRLRTLTLDYSKADDSSVYGTLPRYMLALRSARRFETLELIIPPIVQDDGSDLVKLLNKVDCEMNDCIPHRPDGEARQSFEFVVRGEDADEDDIRDGLGMMRGLADGTRHYHIRSVEGGDGLRLRITHI